MPRAFTLVEIMVVTAVLLLLSAWIAPNLVAIERARQVREREAALVRLPAQARAEALRAKSPVALRVQNADIVLERTPLDQEAQEIRRVSLGDALRVRSVRSGDETASVEDWAWTVYPDGSAQEAAVTLVEGASERTLRLPARGEARWETSDSPADDAADWPAGELAPRE